MSAFNLVLAFGARLKPGMSVTITAISRFQPHHDTAFSELPAEIGGTRQEHGETPATNATRMCRLGSIGANHVQTRRTVHYNTMRPWSAHLSCA